MPEFLGDHASTMERMLRVPELRYKEVSLVSGKSFKRYRDTGPILEQVRGRGYRQY